jgi:hypothetical protein
VVATHEVWCSHVFDGNITPAAAQPMADTIAVCLFLCMLLHHAWHGCIQTMTGLVHALTPVAAQVASATYSYGVHAKEQAKAFRYVLGL